MKLNKICSIAALIGSSRAFFIKPNAQLEALQKSQSAFFSDIMHTMQGTDDDDAGNGDLVQTGKGLSMSDMMNNGFGQPVIYESASTDSSSSSDTAPDDSSFPSAQMGMGALDWHNKEEKAKQDKQDSSKTGASLRSTSSNSAPGIITPSQAISDARDDNVMILSSDYMYVSNCLLRNKHATDPVRQAGFELFKQTAAGEWFIIFGYVCSVDYKCWKKNVQNLLGKKGEQFGGNIVGRCISRLVREKSEGNRMRRRKRRSLTPSSAKSINLSTSRKALL